jgi:hypothetical protein
MLNLRGLAYSYGVNIEFHCNNRIAIHKGGHAKDLCPEDYANQMAFEEVIKEFIKEVNNDRCTNPERFDLP